MLQATTGRGSISLAVERADVKEPRRQPRLLATNWVLVSNLGLTSYSGADGMDIAVRSLADGKPVPGVALRLYARNNGELATAATDPTASPISPADLYAARAAMNPLR